MLILLPWALHHHLCQIYPEIMRNEFRAVVFVFNDVSFNREFSSLTLGPGGPGSPLTPISYGRQ